MQMTSPVERRSVEFGTAIIHFDLLYAPRKTLGISVRPDLSVVVRAPEGKELEAIDTKVKNRAGWILRQQDFFRSFLPLQPPRRYVSGETHYYLGKQYRLKVSYSPNESVKLKGGYIQVNVGDKRNLKRIEELVTKWLNERATCLFEASLERCFGRFERYKLARPRLVLRKMPRRWGSVGKNGVVSLNPQLVKAPRQCIDYVVTHELCHLVIADHSSRFYRLLARVMPDWERWKNRLEYSPGGLGRG